MRPLRPSVLVPCLLFLALLAVPAIQAGSPTDPEVVDALGDAGPVASPAGFEWADITAAWFEEADASTVSMAIEVARLDADPPGEVGVHFRIGTTWWIAGWTTIVFPGPPFAYQGGFACVADEAGDVPDTNLCSGLAASHDGSSFTVALPRDALGLAPGATIEEPRGYAVDLVAAQPGAGQGWIEETDAGRPFVLAGPPAPAASSGSRSTAAPADATSSPESPAPAVEAESADAPSASWAFVALGALALASVRRR